MKFRKKLRIGAGRFLALCLAAVMLAGCGGGIDTQNTVQTDGESAVQTVKTGMLSLLNSEKEEAGRLARARSFTTATLVEEGYSTLEVPKIAEAEPVMYFFDTLDAMLMSLNAGEIEVLQTYQTIAQYLCSVTDGVMPAQTYDLEKPRNAFAQAALGAVLANDFAFLLMEDHAELRDRFDEAILSMKADGTLDRLIREQINDVVAGGEIRPVELPQTEGWETICVAVTGALPPMDYAAPDGKPAGFSTAVLAEVGRRIEKNIVLLVVDSVGRAAALASGKADVVFWTRTNTASNIYAEMSSQERETRRTQLYEQLSQDEAEAMLKVEQVVDFESYGKLDAPNGTIMTETYYSDVIVPVVKIGGPLFDLDDIMLEQGQEALPAT